METKRILKEIGAKEIEVEVCNDALYGKVSFKINEVSFEGQFDIDNKGLYAITLISDLIELSKLNKNETCTTTQKD